MSGYSTIRLRLPEDRDALATLWAENAGDLNLSGKLPDRMAWLYEKNPFGPARTWVGFPRDGSRMIGCGSLIPRSMWVGGRMVSSGVLADFAVDKGHRLGALAIQIQRAILAGSREDALEFVFGWPNARSAAILDRVGYRSIGTATRWVKPLRTGKVLKDFLAKAARRSPGLARFAGAVPLAARLGALPLDGVLWGAERLSFARNLREIRGEVVHRADGRFDELWLRGRRGLPFISGEKTSAYLNWRYADCTAARHRFFTLVERSRGRLIGYVAYFVRGDTAVVADLYCDDLSRMGALLVGCALVVRGENVRSLSVTYIGTSSVASRLRMLGFFERGGDRPLMVYPSPDLSADVKEAVLDPQRWLMFDGELDI